MPDASVVLGNCKEVLLSLDTDSLDALVTDPPAGISFMGRAWDSYESLHHFQDDLTLIFQEVLRVMKPGAHGLVWALPRTSHFTAMALTHAGFEVRDSIVHLFGSGMPKGLNVAKAGAGPEWEGWNTALKPAHEIWWLVRKPLREATVVKQIHATSTGAINIEGCRVATADYLNGGRYSTNKKGDDGATYGRGINKQSKFSYEQPVGRWPANVVLSHSAECTVESCALDCAISNVDAQTQHLHRRGNKPGCASSVARPNAGAGNTYSAWFGQKLTGDGYDDEGGASRFYYATKVRAPERQLSDGTTNQHPTAKSVQLMRYFVRLVTPPEGTILDPFAGSGTTGVAALLEGFNFLGIELDPEHHRVAQLRLDAAQQQIDESGVADRVLDGEF